MMIPIDKIETAGCGRHDTMLVYAQLLRRGSRAPRITVHRTATGFRVVDGAHRLCAAVHVGATKIKAQIIATTDATNKESREAGQIGKRAVQDCAASFK
jgi:hypothetical protein